MENRNEIVRIWVGRSKDSARTRADRARCWAKALELAAAAPGYEVWTSEIGRQELHRVVRSWATPARASKYAYYPAGRMVETCRVYRTRLDGKPRRSRARA